MSDARQQPERFALVIVDDGDPLARQGLHTRDAHYRLRGVLKSLLRGYGFRCISITPDRPAAERSEAETAPRSPRPDRAAGRKPGPLNAMAGQSAQPAAAV